MKEVIYRSVFAKYIEGFIALKCSLGYKYNNEAALLKRFDDFCIQHHADEQVLSKKLVTHWAIRRPCETIGTLGIRLVPIRQLGVYMINLGIKAYVMPKSTLPRRERYIPYIFSDEELKRFFSQTDACRYWGGSPIRHLIMPVLFRILYCCGLRVSEACKMKVNDVNLDTGILTIYNGKFNKDRQVPMSEELTKRCRNYYEKVHRIKDNNAYFLKSSRRGCSINVKTVYFNFRQILWGARISHGGAGKGPRIHDFRHTFAVHCLKKWVEEGRDLGAYLPILKTYLGHTHFRETAYYLRLTADLYPMITKQVEKNFGKLIPQTGEPYENN